jgi:hypothetical protein
MLPPGVNWSLGTRAANPRKGKLLYMKTSTRFTLVAAALVLLGGCTGGTPVTGPTCPRVQIPVVPGDTVTTASGLRYISVVTGSGAVVQANQRVTVHYTGYLTDGTLFDTSREGAPVTFGLNQVVPGFAEGITGMRVGGVRRLIIPPQLAYGANPPRGSCVPPNATLIFDVDLLGISN